MSSIKVKYKGIEDNDFFMDTPESHDKILKGFSQSIDSTFDPAFNGTGINKFDRIFVGETSVSKMMELMGADEKDENYKEKASVLIAAAHFKGDKVKVLPPNAKDTSAKSFVDVGASGYCPDPESKPHMNIFKRILHKLFGAYEDLHKKVAAWERVENNRKGLMAGLENEIACQPALEKNKEALNGKHLDDLNFDYALFRKVPQEDLLKGVKPRDVEGYRLNRENDGQYQGKPIDDVLLNGRLLGSAHNFIDRSWKTLATSMMLIDGMSLEEIANPPVNSEKHAEIGKRMFDLVQRIKSPDEQVNKKAQRELADIYIDGANKFIEQPMPGKDRFDAACIKNDPASRRLIGLIGDIGHDYYQEFGRAYTQQVAGEKGALESTRTLCSDVSAFCGFRTRANYNVNNAVTAHVERKMGEFYGTIVDLDHPNLGKFALENQSTLALMRAMPSAVADMYNKLKNGSITAKSLDNPAEVEKHVYSSECYKSSVKNMSSLDKIIEDTKKDFNKQHQGGRSK